MLDLLKARPRIHTLSHPCCRSGRVTRPARIQGAYGNSLHLLMVEWRECTEEGIAGDHLYRFSSINGRKEGVVSSKSLESKISEKYI